MSTKSCGMILQSTLYGEGNFEVVAPMASGGLVHWWRANTRGQTWNGPNYFASGDVSSPAVIQSSFGGLEVIARVGRTLVHYWRDNNRWTGPFPLPGAAGGEPGFVQNAQSPGNFEVVAPLAAGGLGHWWRDNASASQVWHGPTAFGSGPFQAAALVQSSFGGGANLEVVARQGGQLVHFWRDAGQGWYGPKPFATGAAGIPAFIQNQAGAGNFEVVCPLAAGGMGHWWRDTPSQAWFASPAFGAGAVDAVGLAQSSFGGGLNFEVAARRGTRLEHWWRDATTVWYGPTPIFTEPACNGATMGQCRVALDSGVVAIHAALLPTGRVLVFGFSDQGDMAGGVSRVLDPATGLLRAPEVQQNVFCAGQAHLPDGSVFVAGGHHNAETGLHRFDPDWGAWRELRPMAQGRWYPTCTALADGRVFVVSGTMKAGAPDPTHPVNHTWQIFDPVTNRIGPQQPVEFPFSPTDPSIDLYPFCYLLPSGKLLVHSRHTTRFLSPGTGVWDTVKLETRHPYSRTYPGQGTSVLLPLSYRDGYRARVLVAGGGGANPETLTGTTPATASAEILDLGAATPAWRATTAMRSPRVLPDSVLLPDGTVAVVGGSASGRSDDATSPVFEVEIFNPVTETWVGRCPMRVPRLYHSTALLLPDARVMIAGRDGQFNKAPFDYPEHRVELFSPPYLFQAGIRPVISSSPPGVVYDETFSVDTPQAAGVGAVVLIRAGAVTHGFNMDQRLVELQVIGRTASALTVQAPPDPNVAPPGLYLLFLRASGIPSVGAFIRVNAPPPVNT